MKEVKVVLSTMAFTKLSIAIFYLSVSVNGHGLLTFPSSKNGGTLSISHASATEHFALASFGIIDKAFFDNDHSITPWIRPGEFDYQLSRDLLAGHPQTLVSAFYLDSLDSHTMKTPY